MDMRRIIYRTAVNPHLRKRHVRPLCSFLLVPSLTKKTVCVARHVYQANLFIHEIKRSQRKCKTMRTAVCCSKSKRIVAAFALLGAIVLDAFQFGKRKRKRKESRITRTKIAVQKMADV